MTAEGLSAAARKVRTVLSVGISHAVAMEYVESDPMLRVPPSEPDGEERPARTVDEAARLLPLPSGPIPSSLAFAYQLAALQGAVYRSPVGPLAVVPRQVVDAVDGWAVEGGAVAVMVVGVEPVV